MFYSWCMGACSEIRIAICVQLSPAGDYCLRSDVEDQTNGFFIAVFGRIQNVVGSEMTCTTDVDMQKSGAHTCERKTTATVKRTSRKKRKCRHFPVTRSRSSTY